MYKHLIQFLDWWLATYMGAKAATPNSTKIVVEKYLATHPDEVTAIAEGDAFLDWLDQQIAIGTTWGNAVKPHEISQEADRFRERVRTLNQVRNKYIELNPGT